PFAKSIASMLIVVVIGVPSTWFLWNHHGIRDAAGWGHPPHQFSSLRVQDAGRSLLEADLGVVMAGVPDLKSTREGR
ncbi:hypothetical protein, partial [Marinovum sp.]|uniref:hypothetical protein n=1 Tax=Marinovum sp. TaxID=2024839 RepID=UPI003A91BAAB